MLHDIHQEALNGAIDSCNVIRLGQLVAVTGAG